jgi:hypothetical protein
VVEKDITTEDTEEDTEQKRNTQNQVLGTKEI